MTSPIVRTGLLNPMWTPEVRIAVSHDQISRMAYSIWERMGRPQGASLQNWLSAESRLKNTFTIGPQVTGNRYFRGK